MAFGRKAAPLPSTGPRVAGGTGLFTWGGPGPDADPCHIPHGLDGMDSPLSVVVTAEVPGLSVSALPQGGGNFLARARWAISDVHEPEGTRKRPGTVRFHWVVLKAAE